MSINWGMVTAASRHVVSYSMGAATMAATFKLISAGDAQTITHSIQQISDGVASIAAGVAPLIGLGMGAYAVLSARLKAQMAAVNASGTVKAVPADAPVAQISEPPPKT